MSRSVGEPGEAGFSLVEMMVATALLSMLCAAVLAALLPLLTFSTEATNGIDDVGEVQSAMNVVTADIRAAIAANGAGPVVAGSATTITVVTGTGTAVANPEVTFSLAGTTLSEADYAVNPATGTYATVPYRTVTLSSHIDLPGTTSLFAYSSATANPIAAPLNQSSAAAVASVVVTMVDDGGRPGPNEATLTQQVWVRSTTNGS